MKKIIVGISGASGAIYGISVLNALKELGVETHLVISEQGSRNIEMENSIKTSQVMAVADYTYDSKDFSARISSGSFKVDGMVVAPCSMNTLACVSKGITPNLLTRACDVQLKERRKLVLVTRETPLNTTHLENMLDLSRKGAVIFPPVAAYYTIPESLDDVIVHTTGRILDQLGIENNYATRWNKNLALDGGD